jgi:hypothetical protein
MLAPPESAKEPARPPLPPPPPIDCATTPPELSPVVTRVQPLPKDDGASVTVLL